MSLCCASLLSAWIAGVPTNAHALRALAATVLLSWSLLISGLVGALVLLHCHLVLVGKTTSEFFRDRKQRAMAKASGVSLSLDARRSRSAENENEGVTGLREILLNAAASLVCCLRPAADSPSQDNLPTPSRETRLLPLWQFENVEDIFLQDDLTDLVTQRYEALRAELSPSSAESPVLSPLSADAVAASVSVRGTTRGAVPASASVSSPVSVSAAERELRASLLVELKEADSRLSAERLALRTSDSVEEKAEEKMYSAL